MPSRWAGTVGAVPVNVPSSEMYQGLEKGTLDCALNVASDLKSRESLGRRKAHHYGPVRSGLGWAYVGYNKDFWSGLSSRHTSA